MQHTAGWLTQITGTAFNKLGQYTSSAADISQFHPQQWTQPPAVLLVLSYRVMARPASSWLTQTDLSYCC